MARFARLVVPGYPHHITQRGVRSINIFSDDEDRRNYLQFLSEEAETFGVDYIAWCLMTNHVHLIAVPEKEDSLARAIGQAHKRYTRMKNFREGVRGYLFQDRFNSCVLDEKHLLAAGCYVECNPVAARMTKTACEYKWSSARYHCHLEESDPLIRERRLPEMIDNWADYIAMTDEKMEWDIRKKTRTGRPAGDEGFIYQLETLAGRRLRIKKPGRQTLLEK
jgi:putative transposase